MKLRCQAVAVLLLMAALGMCAQTAGPKASKPPKPPPPPRNEVRPGAAPKSPAARSPEAPKAGGAPKLANPGNPVERLMAMPPEQREQVLQKPPRRQRANPRQRLARFNKLPLADRSRLNKMWSTFNSLSPEKQAIVTLQMQ